MQVLNHNTTHSISEETETTSCTEPTNQVEEHQSLVFTHPTILDKVAKTLSTSTYLKTLEDLEET